MVKDIKSSLFPKQSHNFRKSLFTSQRKVEERQTNKRTEEILLKKEIIQLKQTHTEKRTKMKSFLNEMREFLLFRFVSVEYPVFCITTVRAEL